MKPECPKRPKLANSDTLNHPTVPKALRMHTYTHMQAKLNSLDPGLPMPTTVSRRFEFGNSQAASRNPTPETPQILRLPFCEFDFLQTYKSEGALCHHICTSYNKNSINSRANIPSKRYSLNPPKVGAGFAVWVCGVGIRGLGLRFST